MFWQPVMNISNFYTALKNPDSKFGKYKGGLSPTYMKHYHRALKAVFNFGVSYKIIKENPMQSIKAPKVPKSIPDAFNDENINVFFESISKELLLAFSLTCSILGSAIIKIIDNIATTANNSIKVNAFFFLTILVILYHFHYSILMLSKYR
jgi:hypothetical protein